MTLAPGTLVELIPGFDHLYNPVPENSFKGVYVGARATIRDAKDHHGFPHVFLEWDQSDWRYAGMPNGWSYENHFRPVSTEKSLLTPTDNASQITAKALIEKAEDSRVCPDCGEIHEEQEQMTGEFLMKLMIAEANMMSSDSFLMVTAHPSDEGHEAGAVAATLSDEALRALEDKIIGIASEIVERRLKGDKKS